MEEVDLLGGKVSMDFNQLGTVIFAIGTTMWIPIWSLFEGVAKCIRAFKGTDVTMEGFRSNKVMNGLILMVKNIWEKTNQKK